MQLSPESAIKSHEELTRSLFKLGVFDEVLATSERALQLGSRARALRARRAWALARLGRTSEAVQELDRALAHGPDFPRPDEEHVRVLCVLGRSEDALACLEGRLSHEPTHAEARLTRAMILESHGRRFEAQSELDVVLASRRAVDGGLIESILEVARVGLDALAA